MLWACGLAFCAQRMVVYPTILSSSFIFILQTGVVHPTPVRGTVRAPDNTTTGGGVGAGRGGGPHHAPSVHLRGYLAYKKTLTPL